MRVVNCFTDPRLGGPGTRSLTVGRGLRDRNVDVHFLVPEGSDSLAEAATDAGFPVHRVSLPRIRSPRNIGKNARFLLQFVQTTRKIRGVIDSIDPDVAHVNTPYNFQTARAAMQSDAASVWHFNDTLTPWPINRIAGRLAPRWADKVVISADAVHDYFFDADVETSTLYPPVDVEKFDPSAYPSAPEKLRTELGIDRSGPVVGTIANINPAKGHQYLLEAVPSILEKFEDATFLFVGAKLESQQRYFRRLQNTVDRLGIKDSVQFTGWRSDTPELLSLLDLFVLPSLTEACPVVVLEAMAMQCPVVATDVGGVKELLPSEAYGHVVPPEQSQPLADAMLESLAAPTRRVSRTENARNRVQNRFSKGQCVENHYDLYAELHSQ